jgi:hypothetical protein
VQVDGQDSPLVLEDGLSDSGVVWLGEMGEPVLQLPLKDLHLDLHAVPVAAVQFDQGLQARLAGVLGEREDDPQKLGLPVEVLQPVPDVSEREGVLEKDAPGFGLAEKFGQLLRVGCHVVMTLHELPGHLVDRLQNLLRAVGVGCVGVHGGGLGACP